MKKKYKVLFGVMLGLFILIFGVSCCVIGIADCDVEKNYFSGETNPYITNDVAMVSAHRAGSILAPENTMNAFELGIEEATSGGFQLRRGLRREGRPPRGLHPRRAQTAQHGLQLRA